MNHVKTKENSADLLSYGISFNYLARSQLWCYGPKNMKNGEEVQVKKIERWA